LSRALSFPPGRFLVFPYGFSVPYRLFLLNHQADAKFFAFFFSMLPLILWGHVVGANKNFLEDCSSPSLYVCRLSMVFLFLEYA